MPTKVHLVKAMVFPVVMYGYESWTIKKAEHQRIDVFELWCWRLLLRVPLTARRSSQSIIKEISPECSLERLILRQKLNSLFTWCKELTPLKRPWCWKRLKAGGKGDNRGWDGWMVSLTQWTWVWVNSGSWWWTGNLVCCSPWGRRVGHKWTELNWRTMYAPGHLKIIQKQLAISSLKGFLGGSVVKNLSAVQEPQEIWVRSLNLEDPLGEEMATHSSILAWTILWTEEPCGPQPIGSQSMGHNWSSLAYIQYSLIPECGQREFYQCQLHLRITVGIPKCAASWGTTLGLNSVCGYGCGGLGVWGSWCH